MIAKNRRLPFHRSCTLALGCLLLASAYSFAQDCPHREYAWTRTVGGEQGDYLLGGVAVDVHDNVLIAGEFGGKVDFDPGPGKDNRRPKGIGDAYVSWYRPDGAYGGTYTFGATRGAEYLFNWALSVKNRPLGGFVVGGLFNGKTDFDPTDGKDLRKPKGSDDAFIVGMRDDFSYDWTWTVGGRGAEAVWALAACTDGSVVATGYFYDRITLGEGEAQREFVSQGLADVFVVKLSSTGQFLWAVAFGGSDRDVPETVGVDADGSILVGGTFRNEVDFDPEGQHSVRTSNGGDDLFVLKLSANGQFDWLKTIGGLETDRAISLDIAATGDVYIGGVFGRVVDFNPEGGGDVHDSGTAPRHAYVTRYSGDGSYLWTKSFGGEAYTYVRSLMIDEERLVLTGGYLGTVDLDPGEGIDEHPPFGSRSNYVCYWSPEGEYRLGDVFGGDGFDRTMGIAADSAGSVYVGGDFDSLVADFDPTAGVSEYANRGGSDIFLSKFECGQCEYVDRHDLEYDGVALRSTVYTLAPGGSINVVLSSVDGEFRKSKSINADGLASLRFKGLPGGEYKCSIRRIRDSDGGELCSGEIAIRHIVIP